MHKTRTYSCPVSIRAAAALLLVVAAAACPSSASAQSGPARLQIVFVFDGLRPDSVNREDTPTLYRLREEGVNFVNGHSVFPTVTRVNATALSTGTYPARNGIYGNTLYVPAVNPTHAFSNDNHRNLLKLDDVTGGNMVRAASLAELLAARGRTLAAVSSGSTGSALLLNHRAPKGAGVLINGYLEPGTRVAYPEKVNSEILARFGPAPKAGGAREPYDGAVDWTEEVLREYVIPELKPDVILNWLAEPDHIQHAMSAGSPEARASIRNDDRQIALVLKKLAALELLDKVNLFFISDHGFALNVFGVDVTREMINAGIKASPDSDDVVIASSGQTIAVHVKNREREKIRSIVSFLERQDWTGVIFTAPAKAVSGQPLGAAPGTFSLELIHMQDESRGPDIVFTFPWSSARNAQACRERTTPPARRPDRSRPPPAVMAGWLHGPYATPFSPGARISSPERPCARLRATWTLRLPSSS